MIFTKKLRQNLLLFQSQKQRQWQKTKKILMILNPFKRDIPTETFQTFKQTDYLRPYHETGRTRVLSNQTINKVTLFAIILFDN